MKEYSLLITSCDGFEDAWQPFFQLYDAYWNDKQLPTYLITERKTFHYPGLNIISTQVNQPGEARLPWAETVIRSLHKIQSDMVLMYMDDFFVTDPVNIPMIDAAAAKLKAQDDLDAIYLSAAGPTHCAPLPGDDLYCRVKKFSDYKVSMQACLWKKKALFDLLQPKENAWMFELFGTKRAHSKKLNFFRVCKSADNPIKYINTGITKGKWNPAVVPVFKEHGINIDFSRRGFFRYESNWMIKLTTLKTLLKYPITFGYHYFLLPPLSRVKHLLRSA